MQVVAPLVGAWIEIEINQSPDRIVLSLPLWERGLKSSKNLDKPIEHKSLPLWERGLK